MSVVERDEILWRYLAGEPPTEEFSHRIASEPDLAYRLVELAHLECDIREVSSQPKERNRLLYGASIGAAFAVVLGAWIAWLAFSPEPGTPTIVSGSSTAEFTEQLKNEEEITVGESELDLKFAAEKTRVSFHQGTVMKVSKDPGGAKRIRLEQGKLTASVDPQKEPMRITTPHLEVVVLGTAFEVDVDEVGSFVFVDTGTVEVIYGQDRNREELGSSEGWWQLASGRGVSVASAESVSSPPVIDGEIDSIWRRQTAHDVRFKTQPGWTNTGPAADHSSSWKAMWDKEALYVLIEVNDDIPAFGSRNPWQDDSAEIFVDADHSRRKDLDQVDDFLLFFAPERPDIVPGIGSMPAHPDMTHVTRRTDNGYLVETRLPWSTLNTSAPTPGRRIGFNIATTDFDIPQGNDRSQRTWTPKQQGEFKRPDVMGVLIFSSPSQSTNP